MSCCVQRHRVLPFHRIEVRISDTMAGSALKYLPFNQKWTGSSFEKVSLKSLGLVIQLNHSTVCENPLPCHTSLAIIHTNGIHEVAFRYCGCSRAISPHLQLLRRRIYPSSQLNIMTCATFESLNTLHKVSLTTKSSTYDLHRALETLTNNTGINVPKSKYRPLSRMLLQWRHLKLLMWAGRGHDPTGPEGTKPGELALRCPSCPYLDINLPEGWRDASLRERQV